MVGCLRTTAPHASVSRARVYCMHSHGGAHGECVPRPGLPGLPGSGLDVLAGEAVIILGGPFEGLKVEHGRAADEQLELLPAEELEAIATAHCEEAALEGCKLLPHGVLQNILGVQVHILRCGRQGGVRTRA